MIIPSWFYLPRGGAAGAEFRGPAFPEYRRPDPGAVRAARRSGRAVALPSDRPAAFGAAGRSRVRRAAARVVGASRTARGRRSTRAEPQLGRARRAAAGRTAPPLLSVAGGGSPAGPELTALVTELARLLDAWLNLLPELEFAPMPALDPLGSGSLCGVLWWLLTGEDGTRPAPLLPSAGGDSPYDGPLPEALLRLIRQSGAVTGRLRPALIRLGRQLTRPGGVDSGCNGELLVDVMDQLFNGPVGLEPTTRGGEADRLPRELSRQCDHVTSVATEYQMTLPTMHT
ncbi:hypothetical protein FJT64_018499 [Amphibalanus amphitrite]|uniref:Uncharacterized protein n=1 Tax=Amphibalanus amphitrite TaxID=1232801 RepID=A0A6A4WTM2_AMPAM|nr:hypothetical protein FJT64_018499 [Amphibalanus amphitrite]